jgi:hypothetical protein
VKPEKADAPLQAQPAVPAVPAPAVKRKRAAAADKARAAPTTHQASQCTCARRLS